MIKLCSQHAHESRRDYIAHKTSRKLGDNKASNKIIASMRSNILHYVKLWNTVESDAALSCRHGYGRSARSTALLTVQSPRSARRDTSPPSAAAHPTRSAGNFYINTPILFRILQTPTLYLRDRSRL